jgi:putative Mn2+ efflux pump MntP
MEEKKIDISNENRENNTYKSCCLEMDKRALSFFSQLTISLITIGFSISQLALSESCEKDALYSGILTMIIGCWLPQPSMKKF